MVGRRKSGDKQCPNCGHTLLYPAFELPLEKTKDYIKYLINHTAFMSFFSKIAALWRNTTSIESFVCEKCGLFSIIPRPWKKSSAKSTFGE